MTRTEIEDRLRAVDDLILQAQSITDTMEIILNNLTRCSKQLELAADLIAEEEEKRGI